MEVSVVSRLLERKTKDCIGKSCQDLRVKCIRLTPGREYGLVCSKGHVKAGKSPPSATQLEA